jgi:hypothetical protein
LSIAEGDRGSEDLGEAGERCCGGDEVAIPIRGGDEVAIPIRGGDE